MSRSHSIEVVLLDESDVLNHALTSHGMTKFRMMFMSINPANQQRLPINLKQSIGDLDTTKTHIVCLTVK